MLLHCFGVSALFYAINSIKKHISKPDNMLLQSRLNTLSRCSSVHLPKKPACLVLRLIQSKLWPTNNLWSCTTCDSFVILIHLFESLRHEYIKPTAKTAGAVFCIDLYINLSNLIIQWRMIVIDSVCSHMMKSNRCVFFPLGQSLLSRVNVPT